MYVTVSPGGTITFRYDYRLHGRRETLTLGRYGPGGISLAMARELLLDARKAVLKGVSPALEKQREKRRVVAIKTFGAAMETWLANAGLADSTRAMRKHIIDRDILPVFQNRLLTEIQADDLRALCNKVKERGAPATAVQIRDIVKQVYVYAIAHGEKVDIISRDYIAEGMRHRASELATEWLGPRTELEMQRAMLREVEQERWTGLDRSLQREASDDGVVRVERFAEPRLQRQRQVLIGRLQRLERMGLATEQQPGVWAIHADTEPTLRAMGERGDIIRTMQRAMSSKSRELAVFEPRNDGRTLIGRVVGKGLADELYDKGYLIVDGTDGKAHYVALPPRLELEQYPTGAVVEVKGAADVRAADRNIAVLAVDGVYRTDHHLALAQGQVTPDRDPREVVAAHVRRLEALRRAGIVEREAEGVWRIPDDLAERGRRYDAQRLGDGVAVELKSHLPIERQARVIGATWLDQQLIGGGKGLGDLGFGVEVKDALRQRADFLAEQGLAEHRGRRVVLARNLLATLRGRELAQAAKDIAVETGLEHRPVVEGQRVAGVYRRNVMLASGRYAMLDDGMGFSLVPWKPVIEQRVGPATMRGGTASWELGRQRDPSIG